jgi:hypothetical protein
VVRLTVIEQIMATLSNAIIKAIAEDFTRAQLVQMRQAAVAAVMKDLPRVEITGANYDVGGQSGEFIQGKPRDVVEYAQAAIDYIDSTVKRNNNVVFGDFSNRPAGW